jgi:BirA family biotin operon repressor/biotin-[acetyl-CoA-carboxylase] ligase
VSVEPLTLEAVRACLGERAATIDIECVAETGSTSTDLLARARGESTARRPRLLVAERQTAGRGRHGRGWHAEPGASLTFSLAWPLGAANLSGLSLAVGVAVAEAIDPAQARQRHVGLKWPNDLWLAAAGEPGRKLGGILIETAPIDSGRVAVVGVGLNLLEQRVAEAASGVAWLREIDADATPLSTLERIVPALIEALTCFDGEGFAAFAARFDGRDLLHGRPVRCSGPAGAASTEGVAVGVSASGELLVRTPRGIEAIGSGEVSVRLDDGRATALTSETARSPC